MLLVNFSYKRPKENAMKRGVLEYPAKAHKNISQHTGVDLASQKLIFILLNKFNPWATKFWPVSNQHACQMIII